MTVKERMQKTITFHDLSMDTYRIVKAHEHRAARAADHGEYRTAVGELLAAESLTAWLNGMLGAGWRAYAAEQEQAEKTKG